MRCAFCYTPAVAICRLCGRPVCKNHLAGEKGVCVACSDALCYVCGRRLAIASCAVCGRPVCVNCSVEVKPGIRVCVNCASRISEAERVGIEVRRSLAALTVSVYRSLRDKVGTIAGRRSM